MDVEVPGESHDVRAATENFPCSNCFSAHGLARMARWWYSLPTFVSGFVELEACDIAPKLGFAIGKWLCAVTV